MAYLQNLDHKHILLNAAIRNPPTDCGLTEDWMRRLVDAVGMKLLIGPFVTFCETLGNEGLTGVMCIETSHGSIHVWSEADVPFMRFDLYSCKAFDPEIVIQYLMEFDPYFYHMTLVDRNEGLEVIAKESKQIVQLIDLLSPETRTVYLKAESTKALDLSPEERAARNEYARVRRLYSVTTAEELSHRLS